MIHAEPKNRIYLYPQRYKQLEYQYNGSADKSLIIEIAVKYWYLMPYEVLTPRFFYAIEEVVHCFFKIKYDVRIAGYFILWKNIKIIPAKKYAE